MATNVVYIDGVDIETLGISVTGLPSAWSAPLSPWATQDVPQWDGTRLVRSRADIGARTLELTGLVAADNATDAETTLQTFKDAISGRLVEIRYGYQATRAYYGVLQACEAGLFSPTNLGGWALVEMSFLLPDPYAVDLSLSVVSGATAERVPVQVGTGPTWATVQVVGAATTPTLTFRDHSGAAIGTMAFTGSLLSTDSFVVDSTEGGEVTKLTSGVASNALSLLTAGYAFPIFQPRDGVRSASLWPTIETSAGSVIVTYARRWI
jgi:hypothetical protein